MTGEEKKKLARSLRESARTFSRNSTYTLPAMEDFIKRHIKELQEAANELDTDLQWSITAVATASD